MPREESMPRARGKRVRTWQPRKGRKFSLGVRGRRGPQSSFNFLLRTAIIKGFQRRDVRGLVSILELSLDEGWGARG